MLSDSVLSFEWFGNCCNAHHAGTYFHCWHYLQSWFCLEETVLIMEPNCDFTSSYLWRSNDNQNSKIMLYSIYLPKCVLPFPVISARGGKTPAEVIPMTKRLTYGEYQDGCFYEKKKCKTNLVMVCWLSPVIYDW